MSRDRGRQSGFSLVEMLAALAVLSIAGVALMNAVTQAARAGALARDRALAQTAAETVMNTAILEAGSAGLSADDGAIEIGPAAFEWTIRLEETADPGLARVVLTLERAEDGAFAYELVTFRRTG